MRFVIIMISIVVCSVNPDNLKQFKQNVESTVGSDFEFVVIDNRIAGHSIFEAYNLGVSKTRGDIICFAHEDIIFHTHNWGSKVEEHFKRNANLGALGCAGAHLALKDKDWRDCPYFSMNLIQMHYSLSPEKLTYRYYNRYRKRCSSNLNDVVALDGMWICIRTSLFDKIRFDDKNFKGFHQYDADICFQVLDAGMKVCVCYDVLVEHDSEGAFNPAYFDALKDLMLKWESKLPFCAGLDSRHRNSKRVNSWSDAGQWSKSECESPQERLKVHQEAFLRDYNKAAATIKNAFDEIEINRRNRFISNRTARQFKIKTVYYHLTGLFKTQRKINRNK